MLGRDTSSVFPKEAEKAKKEHLESIKKAVGLDSSKFISESQVGCCLTCSLFARMQILSDAEQEPLQNLLSLKI